MNKKIILFVVLILAVFASISFAETWVYPSSGSGSGETWVYPSGSYGSNYGYSDQWYYTFYWNQPGYNFYYSNDPYNYYPYNYGYAYYDSCYYNCYVPYQPPVNYGCYGNRNCYYDGSVYNTYPPFTPPNNLVYSGPTQHYNDPVVPPAVITPICNDPKGNDGEVRTFGIGNKGVFICRDGSWQLLNQLETPNLPNTGAPNKRGFYGGTYIQ